MNEMRARVKSEKTKGRLQFDFPHCVRAQEEIEFLSSILTFFVSIINPVDQFQINFFPQNALYSIM